MQALQQLETEIARKEGICTKNPDGSLAVSFQDESGDILYPMTFSEEPDGLVRGCLRFSPSFRFSIQEGFELARRIHLRVQRSARISFDPGSRSFYAECFTSPAKKDIWTDLAPFLFSCFCLDPFFTQVADTDAWDDTLIKLALISRTDEDSLQ